MNDYSLIDKFKILMKLISTSPLFLICLILGILILTYFIICIILNKKVNKYLFIISSIIVGILLFINYNVVIINVADVIIDSIFMSLYFPSLPVYISVLLLSNFSFLVAIFSKKQIKIRRIVNIVETIMLDLFLIIIIDVVSKNDINIYEKVTLYTNTSLLVLLQLSMGIFVSNILINLIISAKQKLEKYDTPVAPLIPEIIFD